ncbi:NSFL1 cofactor p47 [Neocloeon triangulifer]|uniref:NSFL1 cofactor p47 n=1 Tax=Neocloeon triangulifer TaxID=2078957 RepID=UPI00286F3003|nr:NSFL1 cofactor p47 [Neocloeon triangulifer]
MADQERMTAEFMELTNASADRAKFFLESCSWDVQMAISNFFENGGADMVDDEPEIVREVPAPPRPPAQVKVEPEETSKKTEKKSSSSSTSRIQTLRTLENSEGSSDEEGQAFYAGGSEHSGQQILGPAKKKGDFVKDIFKSVREHGGEEVDPRQASSSKKSGAFGGTGYRLGQTATESEVVIPSTSNEDRTSPLQITIKMWKTGFSIDDGPLREYENNREFLESIKNGEVPPELVNQARGREVNVDLEDHHMEEFLQPKKKVFAFAGKGHVLGSPAPVAIGATQPMTEKDKESNEDAAKTAVSVDSTQPTTTVQVRLMDGSRLLANLNHTHTVSDLRRFITIARPNLQQQTFYLRTTFPSAELTDDSKTLKEAGLLNAAVLLRLN